MELKRQRRRAALVFGCGIVSLGLLILPVVRVLSIPTAIVGWVLARRSSPSLSGWVQWGKGLSVLSLGLSVGLLLFLATALVYRY